MITTKILYLTPGCFDKGGISRYSRYQIQALREIYGETSVRVLSLLGETKDSLEEPIAITWSANGNSFPKKVLFALASFFHALTWKPSVIHIAHVNFSGLAILLSRIVRASTVLNVYGREIWSGLSVDALYGLRNSGFVISDCYFTKDYLEANKLREKNTVEVIWDCVDLNRFKPGRPTPEILQKYNIPDPQKFQIVLTLGRLSTEAHHKGYNRLIKVFSKIVKKNPHARLIIAGDGNLRDELNKHLTELCLEDKAIFIGSVHEDDLVDVYRAAHVFSLVSNRGEGIPLTPLEAMACGTPILVGNQDGSREAIKNNKNGFSIDPNDSENHVRKIVLLLDNQDLRSSLSKGSIKVAQNFFSYESFRRKHHDFYKSVLSNEPIPSNKSNRFYPVAEPDLSRSEEECLLDAYRSGWISSIGDYIKKFEDNFAAFCNVSHAVAVSNGTTALHLALVASGIGPEHEVIVPSLTFVATAAAVRYSGAYPVFVDSEPEIGTLNPVAVRKAITRRTKAIIAVHLYGHPADMDPILEVAAEHGITVIEDAAEAHGALYKGRKVGGLGQIGTFSFYGNKIITTGEGGMVTTNDPNLDERLRFFRDHAMDPNKRYWHPEIGYNYRLTNLQAAIGFAQLSRIEEILNKKSNILAAYRKAGAEKQLRLKFNPQKNWANSVLWLVCAVLSDSVRDGHRDALCSELRKKGIDTRPYFIPLHLMPPYSMYRTVSENGGDHLLVAESLSKKGFNLPSSCNLNCGDIHYIVSTINELMEKAS